MLSIISFYHNSYYKPFSVRASLAIQDSNTSQSANVEKVKGKEGTYKKLAMGEFQ